MPSKTFKIKEIGQVVGGGTPSTTNPDYYGGGIPWLSPKDLSDYKKRYIRCGEKNITKLGLDNSSARLMPAGTVLLSSRAPIGYIAIAANEICTNQGFKSIIPNRDLVDSEFLYYSLKNNVERIKDLGVGTTFAEISGKVLENYEINLPELDNQMKIVSILSSLDGLIELNQEINANLHDQIFSEFQYVRKSNKLNEVVLMDLCSFISRGVSPKYENNTGYWVLGQTCIRNHIVSMNNARTLISKDYGDKTVHKGDILVNSTGVGSLGRVAQLWFEHPHLVADSHISIVRPKIGYEEYLGCFMMSIEDEIENMAEGSTGQTELPRRSLMQMMISIPEMDILKLFGEKVRPLFDLIYKNLEINEKLTKIRDTLLPKLMSGEIDVSQLNLGD